MEDGIIYVFGQLNTMVMVFDGLAYLYGAGNTFFAGGNGLGLGIAATMAAILNILMSFSSYTTENKLNMHGPLIGLSMYALIAIPTVDRLFVQDIYTGTTVAVQDVPLGIAAVAQVSSSMFFHTAEYFEEAFDNSALHGTAFVSKVTEGNGFMSPLKTLMYLKQESINVTPKHLIYNIVTYSKDCIGRSQRNQTAAANYDHNQFIYSIDPFSNVFLDKDIIDPALYIQQMEVDGSTTFTTCEDLRVYLRANDTSPGSIENYFTDATTYGRSLLNKLAMANEEELISCATSAASCTTASSAITKTEDIVAQVAGGNAQAKEYMKIMMANDFNMMITSANSLNSQSTADVVSSMRYSIELTRMNEAMEGEMFLHFMMKALSGFLAVVYALFPIAMIIMVLQGIKAMSYFGKYIIMVFWLQSWVPVAAVINYISISNVRDAMKAVQDTSGFTVASSDAVFQSAMDAVVTGSNLLAATPLISLVILTGSYFALTSAASGTASPSGGSGAAARMATPAPHGGSPVLNMASQYGDVTGTGNAVMSTTDALKGRKFSSGDTQTSSSTDTAAMQTQRALQSKVSEASQRTAEAVQQQISGMQGQYSFERMSTGAQAYVTAAKEAYDTKHGTQADVTTREGVQQVMDAAISGNIAGVVTLADGQVGGDSPSRSSGSSNTEASLVDGLEMIAPEFAPEIEAARAAGILPEHGGPGSGDTSDGGTPYKVYGSGAITGKVSHNERSDLQSGEGTSLQDSSLSQVDGQRTTSHTDADTNKSSVIRTNGTSEAWTDKNVQTALSEMSEAYSQLQSFNAENKEALQSSNAYNADHTDAISLAMDRIAGNTGNPVGALKQAQVSAVRDAAIDNSYSEKDANQLAGEYEQFRDQRAVMTNQTSGPASVSNGIQSFATFQNNNPEHAAVMSDAREAFGAVLDPARSQLVDQKDNKNAIDTAKGVTANDTLEPRASNLTGASGPTRPPSAGQAVAMAASNNFEGRMNFPSHEREAQAEGRSPTPQSDLGAPGQLHRPNEAIVNANADYADGATLGEAYFSNEAKEKYAQHVHGESYDRLGSSERAAVTKDLNTAALAQADKFLNSMRGDDGQIPKSDMAGNYSREANAITSGSGGTNELDAAAGNMLDNATFSHTGRETAAANVAEVARDVDQMQTKAGQDVRTNGTPNNPNWLTEQENMELSSVAQKLQAENDPGAAQQLWNEHVDQNVSNPATRDSLKIDTDNPNRTPSAQLAAANEQNGGTHSAPSKDLPSAVVTGVSDNVGDFVDTVAGGVNSVTDSFATTAADFFAPSGGGGFVSPMSHDDNDWAITTFAKDAFNGATSPINNVAERVSSSALNVGSALQIGPSEGSAGAPQQDVRASISTQYQALGLSPEQQTQFNQSFNQNLSSISGQQTSVDLNNPLNVGQAGKMNSSDLSDAFVATQKQFENGQK